MTFTGAMIGMQVQEMIVRKSGGKHQYTVLIMAIGVAIVILSTSSLTLAGIVQKHSEGANVFEFSGYCI